MPRARVKLALIDSERARKASFNKRKDGLMKKVSELQTLCDVHVCIVIYDRGSNEPFVWPNRPKVEELIKRYLRLPGFMRLKKALCQERYLKEKVEKMQEKNNIILRSNTAKEMVELMHQNQNGKPIYELDLYQTYALLNFLEAKMKEIQIQIAFFEQASAQSETANKLGVPMGNSMEWPYKILGVDNDRCGNGNELGFQMLHQGYVNNIASSINVDGCLIWYHTMVTSKILEVTEVEVWPGLPHVKYFRNKITGNIGNQMGYCGMLSQYYGDNVTTSAGSITGWGMENTNES